MATTKNITMKQFNGTDYDTLYPKTIGAQIVGAVPIASGGTNGTTAPSGVNNLVAGLSQITPASKDLFPFRDISGNTGGSVTLSNLAVALGKNGVITTSNLAAQASALGFAKIQTGTYVGTETYGANNPCSLTFDFIPKVFILSNNYNDIVALYNQTHADNDYLTAEGNVDIYLTWNNNQVSWYTKEENVSYGPYSQANKSGETYRYCIIG